MKPSISLFEMLHCGVELIQELISEKFIVQDVPLPTRIMERAIVSCTGEVEPFLKSASTEWHLTGWPTIIKERRATTEFISFKAQPTFPTEAIGNQSNHLVQLSINLDIKMAYRHSSVNNHAWFGRYTHVSVHLWLEGNGRKIPLYPWARMPVYRVSSSQSVLTFYLQQV